MAVVFDLSCSIQLLRLLGRITRRPERAFVDSLKGTPSEIALKTFASRAPAKAAPMRLCGLTSVAQPAGADALKDKINGFTIPKNIEATTTPTGTPDFRRSNPDTTWCFS